MDADQALKVRIDIGLDGEQNAEKARAALEGVKTEAAAGTHAVASLATAVPNLDEQAKAFTISSEAEYRSIVKTYEAITAKIPILKAAGKSTEELEKTQENLSAALSTEQAILIAEGIENKAAAAATLEKAAADAAAAEAAAAEAAATDVSTAATRANALAIRESAVLMREFARGNYTRMAGSVSILAQSFDLLKYALTPVGLSVAVAGGAAYLFYEHLEKLNGALDETAGKLQTDALSQYAETVNRLAASWDNAQESLGKYYAHLDTAGDEKDPIKTQLDNVKALRDAQLESLKQIAEATGNKSGAADIQRQIEINNGVGSLTAEQTVRAADSGRLINQANAAMAAAAAADDADKHNKDQLKQTREAFGLKSDLGKRRDAAAAALEDAKNLPDYVQIPGEAAVTSNAGAKNAAIAAAQAQVAAVAAETKNLQTRETQLKAEEFRLAREKEVADENAKTAQKESETNQARLKQLPGEITQAGAIQGAKDFGTQGVALLTTRMQGTNETLDDYLKAAMTTDVERNRIIGALVNHQLTMQQEQNALSARIAQLQAQGNLPQGQ